MFVQMQIQVKNLIGGCSFRQVGAVGEGGFSQGPTVDVVATHVCPGEEDEGD